MFRMVRDPVCGAKVNKKTTEYQAKFNGRLFYFDCAACKATFEENSERYAGGGAKKSGLLSRLSEASDGQPKNCHTIKK